MTSQLNINRNIELELCAIYNKYDPKKDVEYLKWEIFISQIVWKEEFQAIYNESMILKCFNCNNDYFPWIINL